MRTVEDGVAVDPEVVRCCEVRLRQDHDLDAVLPHVVYDCVEFACFPQSSDVPLSNPELLTCGRLDVVVLFVVWGGLCNVGSEPVGSCGKWGVCLLSGGFWSRNVELLWSGVWVVLQVESGAVALMVGSMWSGISGLVNLQDFVDPGGVACCVARWCRRRGRVGVGVVVAGVLWSRRERIRAGRAVRRRVGVVGRWSCCVVEFCGCGSGVEGRWFCCGCWDP